VAISAPLLDGCALAVLERGDSYGYALTQWLRQELDISESTIYPVLRRLQRDGLLRVYDQEYQGRNRRWYAITGAGRERLEADRRAWEDFRDRVDAILLGGIV